MKKHIILEIRVIDDYDNEQEAKEELGSYETDSNGNNRITYKLIKKEELKKYGIK